jgi:hypothetical protein
MSAFGRRRKRRAVETPPCNRRIARSEAGMSNILSKSNVVVKIQFNSIQFFIINVLAQQPQGQVQRQHKNIRKIHKWQTIKENT